MSMWTRTGTTGSPSRRTWRPSCLTSWSSPPPRPGWPARSAAARTSPACGSRSRRRSEPPVMAITQFELPRTRRILAGPGSRRALAEELDAIGARRVAIVTSPSVASQAMYRELRGLLGGRVAIEYCRIRPHPATELIVELITLSAAARPDGYLAIGGGSVIDAAKLAGFGAGEQITDTR